MPTWGLFFGGFLIEWGAFFVTPPAHGLTTDSGANVLREEKCVFIAKRKDIGHETTVQILGVV